MDKKDSTVSRDPNPDKNPTKDKGEAELPGQDTGTEEVVLEGGGGGMPGSDVPPGAREPRATYNGPGIRHTPLNRADPHPRKSGAV